MKLLHLIAILFFSVFSVAQTRYNVTSDTEFRVAQDQAISGDTIAWIPGIYSNIRQEIDKNGLVVTAIPHGSVLFTGASRAVVNADSITFSGFQYIGGVIGSLDVIKVYGSDVIITQVNIQNYTSHKYLVVDEDSRRTTISYCNFENRLNLDDKNILSILVDDEPGYHKIQRCSFKNFEGIGKDEGIEPIRIGLSSQAELASRTLVEYCYFTQCNGDGEIISHKSRQNVYRYNTFEDNPVAELVLRHGDEGIVYGNFFLGNMGGVRIREGADHYIYNNYFSDIDRRAIILQNDPSDPLTNIHIYHNTIINSEELILGSSGSSPPTGVVIANNVFSNPKKQIFTENTGNETWISNISFGNLGIEGPPSGMLHTNPLLLENSQGFFQPEMNSPLLSAGGSGYPAIALYPNMNYDDEILLDLMQETRPISITERAIGASEYSLTTIVQPHATELNTGPSYLFDNLVNYIAANLSQLYIGNESNTKSMKISSNIDWTIESSVDWISMDLLSGSGDAKIQLMIDKNDLDERRFGLLTIMGGSQSVTIDVYQDPGEVVSVEENPNNEFTVYPNPNEGKINLANIPAIIQSSLVELSDLEGRLVFSKEYLVKDRELEIELDTLLPGIYTLNMKLLGPNKALYKEVRQKIVRR